MASPISIAHDALWICIGRRSLLYLCSSWCCRSLASRCFFSFSAMLPILWSEGEHILGSWIVVHVNGELRYARLDPSVGDTKEKCGVDKILKSCNLINKQNHTLYIFSSFFLGHHFLLFFFFAQLKGKIPAAIFNFFIFCKFYHNLHFVPVEIPNLFINMHLRCIVRKQSKNTVSWLEKKLRN